jgi:hypothetical protein
VTASHDKPALSVPTFQQLIDFFLCCQYICDVSKHNSTGGRPKHVAEFVEGKQAATNFTDAMRQIISGQKNESLQTVNAGGKRQRMAK